MSMIRAFRKRIRKSDKYKYVTLFEFNDCGRKKQLWVAKIGRWFKAIAYFDSERDAALFVDKQMILNGRKPVNILRENVINLEG